MQFGSTLITMVQCCGVMGVVLWVRQPLSSAEKAKDFIKTALAVKVVSSCINAPVYKEAILQLFMHIQEFDTFGKMVNVLKGILIECDPAMKQFLLYLDESNALGKKFIIQDLDETHVFVLAEMINCLQEKVGELMDQNSFPITQK